MLLDYLISILIIIVFVAVISIGWRYRRIIRRIHKLSEAADRIKEGDLESPIDDGGEDDLGRLASAMEDMRRHLKDAAEEKQRAEDSERQLIANIAHDLKTPITAIAGYAQGLYEGVAATPEKQLSYTNTIYRKAHEMDHLIDELTFYSRMDSNRIPYHFEKVNAADYFADCATEVSMDLENRQIQFLQDISIADDTVILIDRQQVKRVFQNLFDNAVKYMDKPDGRITFSVFDESDEVHIRISDNGKGIAEEDLPHIFERMYRGDASRSSSVKGSGLGLAITKKIVEDHGGSISAVSGEKEGTTIDVTLKRYREDRR